jgi:hypothetical protein
MELKRKRVTLAVLKDCLAISEEVAKDREGGDVGRRDGMDERTIGEKVSDVECR